MRLEKASHEAIKYSSLHFHYAKRIPSNCIGYSVFNEWNEWCGTIVFGVGANNNAGKAFNLKVGEMAELLRVALNGKQGITSRAVSLAVRLLRKDCPLLKLLVSYADEAQNHRGTLYQAMNWYFVGDSFAQSAIDPADGRVRHTRTLHSKYGSIKGFERVKEAAKHKYLYPLDKSMIELCEQIRRPYLKAESIKNDASKPEVS